MQRICLLGLVAGLAGSVPVVAAEPAPTKTGFVDKVYKNSNGSESPYVIYVPTGYDASKKYPVILFLHGSGETKGGTKKPVEVGIGPAIKKLTTPLEAFVVIPQSEKRTWQAASEDGKRAIAILDEVIKSYSIDPKRVSLTGLSMGGFGTWSLAAAYPERWSAIAPICGGGNPKDAEKIKHLPCWCFHGDKDTAVKVELSRTMIEALKKAGGMPKYTEYPGVAHNSWDKAYGEKEFFPWILSQELKSR
jgi:predicted peptidase